jgi:predicted membrane-bound spermidine synthase
VVHVDTYDHCSLGELFDGLNNPLRVPQLGIDLQNDLTGMTHFVLAVSVFVHQHILVRYAKFLIAQLFEVFIHGLLSFIYPSHNHLGSTLTDFLFNLSIPLTDIRVRHDDEVGVLNFDSKGTC